MYLNAGVSRVMAESAGLGAQLGWEGGNWPFLALLVSKFPLSVCLPSLCGSCPQGGYSVSDTAKSSPEFFF